MKRWNVKYPNRFNLGSEEDYLKWRDEKLAAYPRNVGELVVELGDMTALRAAERTRILETVERANMCVFTAGSAELEMASLLALGRQLGVTRTDKSARHSQSDELTDSGILNRAIPFSTRHCNWHTDATYYGSDQTIEALFLLCKRPALEGGSNKVLDHEVLYIHLRDTDRGALEVLMNRNCFNYRNPTTGEVDPHRGGKVFWTNAGGHLCHRFSFRKTDMAWSDESDVAAARKVLESVIADEPAHVIEGRLESGMGLVSNNVLHTRERLVDSDDAAKKRLLFRARFYDRVSPE
ncbi:MAG: TauD/TfdA family dioxygenase [Thiobacillus sp.]|uniref:TauD/TfdA family dioxygenase n=1 Tax=Thiobacillus sp. TaxID=924 RepID=UPI0028944C6C|nr:TauD/TfdA family dioxygenase [Thiobacillus sp.]MDT3706683.1 TauD/TfdA family dioxygenase [Thiobacillus sp.]